MKNVRRALLKRKPRKKQPAAISQDATTPTGSPITGGNRRVSDLPVSLTRHVSPRRESEPIPLVQNTMEAWSTPSNKSTASSNASSTSNIPKVSVGFVDDPGLRGREGVISITKDVQKFLATISELRQAMEELDAQQALNTPTIRLLSVDNDEIETTDGRREPNRLIHDDSDEEDEMEGDGELLSDDDQLEDDNVDEKLKELVEVVKVCLHSNPGMQSTSLINASKDLLKTYKHCDHDNGKVCECSNCSRAIDILVDTFTECVSEYMIGDNNQIPVDPAPAVINGNPVVVGVGSGSGPSGGVVPRTKSVGANQKGLLGSSKSHDNLAMFSSNLDLSKLNDPVIDQIDQALANVEKPITVASDYIKFRQKYHRELVGYLNKRAQLEQKYYSNLGRLVKQSQGALTELEQQEESLPLINVFRSSLENDSRYAMNSNTTFNLQVTHKILEPLERQIQECEKSRKVLMNNWIRESKKVSESRSAMKAAKVKYEVMGQDLVRLKNVLSNEPTGPRAEKRKKEIADMEVKWQEAETTYKDAVAHCNDCQYQVHEMAQKSILCAFRRIIIGFDTALKAGLLDYFSLQHNFFQSLPDPLLKGIDETKEYEVGAEFLHFISLQPQTSSELEDYHFEEFDPESELWDVTMEGGSGSNGVGGGTSIGKLNPDLSRSTQGLTTVGTSNDTKSNSDRSVSPLPFDFKVLKSQHSSRNDTASPKPDTSRRSRPKSVALIDTITSVSSPNFFTDSPKNSLTRRNSEKGKETSPSSSSVSPPSTLPGVDDVVYSKMAKTHSLKKLRTPARCRGCDTYVYFHGFDCEICGLACHRKCLATLAIRCGTKKLPRKMNVFGIDFHDHLKATNRPIPIIVTKCINEIDIRGLNTQGLYRISSAKTKMEKLCQLFESGSERVDLSELPPHLISSCLKLYFRTLPEPLLTFAMYQEFLTFAREASSLLPCKLANCDKNRLEKVTELLDRLKGLLARLSEDSQVTLARLMYHLNRVSSPDHVRVNCMPASNLGIVFGPNLLRQKEMVPSLALLANMSLQAKAVEIMVAHAQDIFAIPENELKQMERDASEDTEVTPSINTTIEDNSTVDDDDAMDAMKMKGDINDTRTPVSTPPEKRKMKMEELNEAIQGFSNGNLLSPVSSRSKVLIMPPPAAASPLLQDSRQWQDCAEVSNLPGLITENENFAEALFHSLDRRLQGTRPHSTALEKALTPVMEIKDDGQQSGESSDEGMDKIRIQRVGDNSIIEKVIQGNARPRPQSLSKSCSTGLGEESDSINSEGDVFHSRTASNASSIVGDQGLYHHGSRSEDNLLEHDRKYSNATHSFNDADFMKYTSEERLTNSNDSLKYEPFESADVQALLSPSKPPTQPHTYPRPNKPPHPHHPTRQMSEGEIKHQKPVHFSVGSPPYDSPISFQSIDKSTSIASSQGSFSEGIVEDLSSPLDSKAIHLHDKEEREETRQQLSNNKLHQESIENEKQLNNASSSDNQQPSNDSTTEDDLPFPDNSPGISNQRLLKNHHKHSISRDSGLSDSPDPFSDLSPSPSHAVNSYLLTDRLSQMTKSQLSPLVNRNQVSKPETLTENTKKFQEILQTTTNPSATTKPHPKKVTKHVARVMKITPSYENTSLLSPPSIEENGRDVNDDNERLRMASPDELLTATDKQLSYSMKRSLSHGATLGTRSSEDDIGEGMEEEEEGTIVGKLRISEAKVGGSRKVSRSDVSKDVSRSLDNLIDNNNYS